MRILGFLLAAAFLASCGANGAPVRPNANVGLSVGNGGVSTNASVGATNGTVTVGVGF